MNSKNRQMALHAAFFIILFWVTITTPYNNSPVIRSDGRGYHVWTHQLMSGDWNSCDYRDVGYLRVLDNGNCLNKYPMGTALIKLPFMYLSGVEISSSEITGKEHAVVLWSSAFACLLLYLVLIVIAVNSGVTREVASYFAFATFFGTGLFHYGTYDASFSHIFSALFTALLLLLFQIRDKFKTFRIFYLISLLSVSCFLLLLRNTNIFLIGVAILLFAKKDFYTALPGALASVAGAAIGIALQLAYNVDTLGRFSLSSYKGESFLWDRPMAWDVFMSYERGLLTYYPVYFVALLIMLMYGRRNPTTWACISITFFYCLFYGYWHSWTLGGGFGHRGFVDIVPLIMLGAVQAWNSVKNHKRFWKGLSTLSVATTVILMSAYWSGALPFSETSRRTYWKQFQGERIIENFTKVLSLAEPFQYLDSTGLKP